MTPSTLTAIRSILGSHFSEARAKALYRVVLEELTASRDHEPAAGSALDWQPIDSAPNERGSNRE